MNLSFFQLGKYKLMANTYKSQNFFSYPEGILTESVVKLCVLT